MYNPCSVAILTTSNRFNNGMFKSEIAISGLDFNKITNACKPFVA